MISTKMRAGNKVQIDEVTGISMDYTQAANHNLNNQSESPQVLNNKFTRALSKKKRVALKKKENMEEKKGVRNDQQIFNYVLVEDQAGIHASPLQIQDSSIEKCILNKRVIPADLSDD